MGRQGRLRAARFEIAVRRVKSEVRSFPGSPQPGARATARSRTSFAGNQAPERRPRGTPMPSAREIQHEAGDEQRQQRSCQHEQQLARPSENAAAVDIEHAREDPLAGRAGFRRCVGESTVTGGNATADCALAIVVEEAKSASRNTAPRSRCERLLPVRWRWLPASRQSALIVTSLHFHYRTQQSRRRL
jgi:hypothetical protein